MPAVAAAALIWRKTHPSDVRMPLRVITAALVALMLVPPGLAAQPARELFGAIHAPTSGPATPIGGYAKGCLAALTVGFVLGVFRLAVDTPVSLGMAGFAGGYNAGSFLWIVNNVYFQYYSLMIFVVSSAVLVGVSYSTEAPDPAQLRDLTFATMSDEHRRESRASWTRMDVINSGLVLALILAAYLYFNG